MTAYTLNTKETCLSGGQQTEAVYRFSFDVNPSDVLELDATLGDCVLHDPVKAVSLFQSVSFTNKNTQIPNLLVRYTTIGYLKLYIYISTTVFRWWNVWKG